MALRQGTPKQASRTLSADFDERKIYCANCVHCKVKPEILDSGEKYQLRVRCIAGKWKKKLGEEKFYKYFTVARRSIDTCDAYEPMGETKEFLRDLKKSLPLRDEVYNN